MKGWSAGVTAGKSKMADDLEVIVSRSNGSVDLVVAGDIDLPTLTRFNRALRDAIYEAHQVVTPDLSEVRFISSAGISALLGAWQLAADESVTLLIVKASREVKHVLELLALDHYFT